jgi:NADH-quinone oxidoreductase subunit N
MKGPAAAAAVLYYLVVYAFANVGAFAVAAWLARDLDSDNIDDLNGLGSQQPLLAVCILLLMLSLIGIPPLAGFFGKLYVFMEALNQTHESQHVTLIWLVALGLLNSVVSAFYYVRVLKAMFLRGPGAKHLAPPDRGIALPIVLGTVVVALFGLLPDSLIGVMQAASVPMLTNPARMQYSERRSAMEKTSLDQTSPVVKSVPYTEAQLESTRSNQGSGYAPAKKQATPAEMEEVTPAQTKSDQTGLPTIRIAALRDFRSIIAK